MRPRLRSRPRCPRRPLACASRSPPAPVGRLQPPHTPAPSPTGRCRRRSPTRERPRRPAQRQPLPVRPSGEFTFAFAGDVNFAKRTATRLAQNPATAFGVAAGVLSKADLTMVNLETAITSRDLPPQNKSFVFHAPPTALTALRDAGVDLATMANNHGADYGLGGLHDTLAAIAASKFPVIGIGADAAQAFAPYRDDHQRGPPRRIRSDAGPRGDARELLGRSPQPRRRECVLAATPQRGAGGEGGRLRRRRVPTLGHRVPDLPERGSDRRGERNRRGRRQQQSSAPMPTYSSVRDGGRTVHTSPTACRTTCGGSRSATNRTTTVCSP